MIKLFVKVAMLFVFWRPAKWRKSFKMKLESRLYSGVVRRRAKKCGRLLNVLGPGVNVTFNTTIGEGVGFGKDVKIRGDGPVFIGKFAAIAEDTLIYTQVHDYDHSKMLPFGSGFTYPETRIDDYAWIGMRSIVLPGAHIGEGAIVQAGSVVMGKVPPCAIVAGNPAKVIGWRDIDHYNKIKVAIGEKPIESPGGELKDQSVKIGSGERGTGNGERGDDRLTDIFCSVFSVTPEEARTMTYKGHPAWDSAGQMALAAAIEREFGRTLSPEEIYRLRSYADAIGIVGGQAVPHSPFPVPRSPSPVFNLDRDGVAVSYDGREVTFRELKAMGEKLVAGIAPRTVRLVKAANTPETVALYAACINHGIVPLMLPEKIDEALYEKLRATYEGAKVHEDLALLLSTSGSTGSPKLVRTSYSNLKADCSYAAMDHRLSNGDVFLVPLPLCYAFGVQVMSACLYVGATMVLSSKTVMDPGFADLMESSGATHFVGVPYMYEMMDRLNYFSRNFPKLRNLSISGGALGPALRRKYSEWARGAGKVFCEIYGQTETLAYMAKIETSEDPDRVGSIGKASSGGRFSLKDGGELVYEGPIVAMGYATCAEDLLKGDEWKGVRETGDMATIDADGYVTLTGRASRFLKIFGNRVSLQEVENILKDAFPASSIAATGEDNDLHVFATSASAEEIERMLVAKLHFNATVMKVHVLDSMPLNSNGKTDYQGLKPLCLQTK
jgi:acyl-coenzyme A synthetase/AMP-(fatty) acid ligase/acetyltransferase-like isoleucine patch superfamily enzyme/acyl carrier protein